MENFNNLEQNTVALEVTENSKNYLKTIASWSKFFAILTFVGIGIFVFVGLIMFAAGTFIESYSTEFPFPIGYMSWFYIILAVVAFFPARYLLLFSQKAVNAIAANNTLEMENSFKNMKSYWKFMGIVTIIYLALCLTVFPIVMIALAASGALAQ